MTDDLDRVVTTFARATGSHSAWIPLRDRLSERSGCAVSTSASGMVSRDARGDTVPLHGIAASPSSFELLLIRAEINLVRPNQTERD